MSSSAPIAVFDSGVGGLTVVRALRRELPAESVIYLGDTARVPYGGKSRQTIERYAEEIVRALLADDAKMVVVACNTASALALPRLRELFSVPIVGVIEPGVDAAIDATRSGHVAVIATKATVRSGAYEQALHAARANVRVTSLACPLLVPLIEEGLIEDPLTDSVLRRYLDPVLSTDADTLVLGCTHYPLLAAAIARAAGPRLRLVDSAANCARAVREHLEKESLLAPADSTGSLRLFFTDAPDIFLGVAGHALGLETRSASVRPVPHLGAAGDGAA
ncbi:MAG: glutamate racemase [Chthoniobacterales bacterium]|jgi:glutamate racemase